MTKYEKISYRVQDDIAYITLNQPDILNAMSKEMGEELFDALKRAPNEARVAVLGSKGRAFCSGANLSASGTSVSLDDPDIDMGIRLEHIFNPMLKMLRDYPIPFITSIRGPAVGFGCGLGLMGDIIVASKTAFFLESFSKIGLTSDGGAAYLMTRAIGRIKTMEIMLLAERYPAEQAFKDGLVTRLVEDDDLEDATNIIARKLAAGPPISLKFLRQSTWAALDSNFGDQLDRERELQRTAGRTKDFQEGVNAFREKRPPNFTGQ